MYTWYTRSNYARYIIPRRSRSDMGIDKSSTLKKFLTNKIVSLSFCEHPFTNIFDYKNSISASIQDLITHYRKLMPGSAKIIKEAINLRQNVHSPNVQGVSFSSSTYSATIVDTGASQPNPCKVFDRSFVGRHRTKKTDRCTISRYEIWRTLK